MRFTAKHPSIYSLDAILELQSDNSVLVADQKVVLSEVRRKWQRHWQLKSLKWWRCHSQVHTSCVMELISWIAVVANRGSSLLNSPTLQTDAHRNNNFN